MKYRYDDVFAGRKDIVFFVVIQASHECRLVYWDRIVYNVNG